LATRTLPLFPLKVVLFPGMVLPLHIFEPRYRQMVRRCLAEQLMFGVVLIKEGEEVGEPAEPFSTGTLAAIQEINHYEDGRMDLVTVGVSRFRLLEPIQGEPYAQGLVEVLDDPQTQADAEAARDIHALFEQYLHMLGQIADVPLAMPEPGADAVQLSYHVATVIPIGLIEKQRLLEMPSVGDRLEAEREILCRETQRVQEFASLSREKGYFYYRGKRLSLN
jgi:Lon protease-like protein